MLVVGPEYFLVKVSEYAVTASRILRTDPEGETRVGKRSIRNATGGISNSIAAEILRLEQIRSGQVVSISGLIPISFKSISNVTVL